MLGVGCCTIGCCGLEYFFAEGWDFFIPKEGNFPRDGDEFSSLGNFIYITRGMNPDRGCK